MVEGTYAKIDAVAGRLTDDEVKDSLRGKGNEESVKLHLLYAKKLAA